MPTTTLGPTGSAATHETSAQRRSAILAVVRSIPRGEVRSYAEVAGAAGWPRHARLVAKVLSSADERGLPWHRVVRADGNIAFPVDSAQALEQAERLRSEGVHVRNGRRVALREFSERSLDRALWAEG